MAFRKANSPVLGTFVLGGYNTALAGGRNDTSHGRGLSDRYTMKGMRSAPLKVVRTGKKIRLFKAKEKEREIAENSNGMPPIKKQSLGELRLSKGKVYENAREVSLRKIGGSGGHFPVGETDLIIDEAELEWAGAYHSCVVFLISSLDKDQYHRVRAAKGDHQTLRKSLFRRSRKRTIPHVSHLDEKLPLVVTRMEIGLEHEPNPGFITEKQPKPKDR
ncbi:NEDD8-conjugating enzyme Ubc12 [Artemisia annua]|uniref:NEDD8-conjugating enzyme Ubc12 n=1 Tax=Artemisia annua TaxID=35608 RepID=A0A2U1LYG8_ARTAN|nr:NEDD8-conjugating enzyme Ubc12 [Artemisia annua]